MMVLLLNKQSKSSEVFLKPVKVAPNPFRKMAGGLLVLCDTWVVDKKNSQEKHD